MYEDKANAFNNILEDIKKGTVMNTVLLCGTEQFLVSWAKNSLVDKFVNPATRALDLKVFEPGEFSSDSIESLREAASTTPLMSERKVVLIENYEKAWKADAEKLAEFIPEVLPGTLLIITAPPEDRNRKGVKSKLKEAVAKHGRVYEFGPLSERDLIKFINKRLNALEKNISPQAMNLLLQTSGYFNSEIDYALYNLESDIKKIAALAKGPVIGEEEVAAGISDNLEYNVFKMLDAVSQNRKELAFKLIHDMLLHKDGNEHQMLATIIGQLELMLMAKELSEKGMTQPLITRELKVHEYRVKKAMNFSSKYTLKDLRRILMLAFDVDRQIKTGLLEGPFALEMFIASI